MKVGDALVFRLRFQLSTFPAVMTTECLLYLTLCTGAGGLRSIQFGSILNFALYINTFKFKKNHLQCQLGLNLVSVWPGLIIMLTSRHGPSGRDGLTLPRHFAKDSDRNVHNKTVEREHAIDMHASSSRPTDCGNSPDCSCSSMLTNDRAYELFSCSV